MDAARAICRWLIFLPLAFVLAIWVGMVLPPLTPHAGLNPIGSLAGIVLAWIIASLPTYKHRRRVRRAIYH
jgi:Na+-driven multidrug efflux pump